MASFGAGLLFSASAAEAGANAGAPSAYASDVTEIRDLLTRYETALNASSTDAVLPLYADDGVFMPAFSPSAVGLPAVRQAYDAVFKAIKLEVKFDVVEIVPVSATWAFARTNSAGSVTIHATGERSDEANQELFVFQKGPDARWKIARYSFSPTNPPRS
jgi:uncharacterized protein (TIGR02246 family)